MARGTEYRVVWKRVGCHVKRREFKTHRNAERFMRLFGPEPWTYTMRGFDPTPDPDAWNCCDGRECGCGGETVREYHEARRANMPALEYVRLECREVGAWGVPVGVDA